MKGLLRIPSPLDLQTALERLGPRSSSTLGPISLALYSQYARFDPRVAETWIETIARHWKEIPPLPLRERILRQPWPQAAALLLDQCEHTGLIARAEVPLFKKWKTLITDGISKAPGEIFLIGVLPFASRQIDLSSARSLKAYQDWGYLAPPLDKGLFVNKARQKLSERNRSALSRTERKRILDSVLRSSHRITVADYREALGYLVSQRVAELDLKADSRLSKRGATKGRFYIVCRSKT